MDSVVIKSADRAAVECALLSHVAKLRVEHPEIRRIIWFGSWVTGLPTPGSDVDLCLVLASSAKAFRERVPDYLPIGFPVGIDLFPYTEKELGRVRESSPGWHREIMSGREL